MSTRALGDAARKALDIAPLRLRLSADRMKTKRDQRMAKCVADAKRAVDAARHRWPRMPKADVDEIESDLAQALHRANPDNPVAWGTRYAQRALSKRHRRSTIENRHAERAQKALTRKASDEPAIMGRPKAKTYGTLNELRSAVRVGCLKEFRTFAKRDWTEDVAVLVRPKVDRYAMERQARDHLESLRKAMRTCSEFTARVRAERGPHLGSTLNYLAWWVPRFIDPLLKHAAIQTERDDKDLLDPFAAFIRAWDDYDILGLGPRGKYASGFLSDRELTIVSLLGGFFPQSIEKEATKGGRLKPETAVGTVIELQKAAVRTTRRRHGRLRDAISKALANVAPMPKGARYVLKACDHCDGNLAFTGEVEAFLSLQDAASCLGKRWPGASLDEMELGRNWRVWDAVGAIVATVELTDFSQNSAKTAKVPK